MLRYFAGAVHNRCALRLLVSALADCLTSHQPQVLPAIIATVGSGTVASGRAERMASGSCWLRREVAQIHALSARCTYKQAVEGPKPPCTNPACSHAAVISAQARWRGEVRCSAHYDGWPRKRQR